MKGEGRGRQSYKDMSSASKVIIEIKAEVGLKEVSISRQEILQFDHSVITNLR